MNDGQGLHWLNPILAHLPCFTGCLSPFNSHSHEVCIDLAAATAPAEPWPGAPCTLIFVQEWKLLHTVKYRTITSLLLLPAESPRFSILFFPALISISSSFSHCQYKVNSDKWHEPSYIFSRVCPTTYCLYVVQTVLGGHTATWWMQWECTRRDLWLQPCSPVSWS